MASLSTLVSFNGSDGGTPDAGLIADANGDLFGTTTSGGVSGKGTVFEIIKTSFGYESAPTTLLSFNGSDGETPFAGLIADANGDLFGTTYNGGANDDGTVFEIAKSSTGYASAPTTLVSFNGADGATPFAGLIADANGDLFGTTTSGGGSNSGTVYVIVKTSSGYASAPTTLVSFNGSDGATPLGLIADANGDLFGTTNVGGANGTGTAFEIAKTPAGYASAPTTLVNFNHADGENPTAGLIEDTKGDLFGTTNTGGAFDFNDGTVFEIAKTSAGYASAPTTLVTFGGSDGMDPYGLITDANGDLFGTTNSGGASDDGTVFEIAKTSAGYASVPTTLVSFNGSDGASPAATLIADANGDLFGTTESGGANNAGTVFEITDSGFVPSDSLLLQNRNGQASIWEMNGNARVGGGAVSVNPGPAWTAVGTGTFFSGDTSDILWQNASTGQLSVWEMDGATRIGGGAVSINPGPAWKAVGTGDFNGDHLSDILFQNTSTGQASVWEMDGTTRTGGGAVSIDPGTSWKAIGTGDFTDEGFSDDILFQNASTGQLSIWEMDGNTRTGGGAVSINPGPAWQAIGTGDFYGAGNSDILFQNASTGQVAIWEMNGNQRTGGGAVSLNPGPAWRAIGTDGGGSDILFQNISTGQASIWDMDGTTRTGGGAVSVNAGPSWRAVDLT